MRWLLALPLALIVWLAVPLGYASAQTTPNIQSGLCSGANLQFTTDPGSADCTTNGDAVSQINNLIHQVVNILSVIVGITAVIMIIVGGFRYITSGGSDASVTSAKNTILYAIIGLIVVALSQLLVRFVLGKVSNG